MVAKNRRSDQSKSEDLPLKDAKDGHRYEEAWGHACGLRQQGGSDL